MRIAVLSLIIFFFGCSHDDNDVKFFSQTTDKSHPFPPFKSFPDQVYNDIHPGMTFESVIETLSQHKWTPLLQTETCIYLHPVDSTQILFKNYEDHPSTQLNELKIFLFSKRYTNPTNDFPDYLEKRADNHHKNGNFSVLTITQPIPYTLTIFSQETSVRLVIHS